jgi:hypothetical protein
MAKTTKAANVDGHRANKPADVTPNANALRSLLLPSCPIQGVQDGSRSSAPIIKPKGATATMQ